MTTQNQDYQPPVYLPREPSQVPILPQIADGESPRDTPSHQAKRPRGLCGLVSQWLWSGWRGMAFEGAKSPHLAQTPYKLHPGDCKTCREHFVSCDHTRPQCSYCWSQQLLCFYVEPKQKRQRKTKSTASHLETGSAQVLPEDATV